MPETATLVADSSDGFTLSIKVDLNAFQSENDLLIHRYTYFIYLKIIFLRNNFVSLSDWRLRN